MKNLKVSLLISLLLSAIGCNATSVVHVYEVEGATRNFCIPDNYTVSTPSWIPENSPNTPKGFAFSGCSTSGQEPSDCQLPEEVVTGGVGPKESFDGWRWEDFPVDAYYRKLINEPQAQVYFAPNEDLLVVKNPSSTMWMIWKKAEKSRDSKITLAAGDELIEVCEHRRSPVISAHGQSSKRFVCTRHVAANDYALQYSFYSESEATEKIQQLDEQVFASIENWRCTK